MNQPLMGVILLLSDEVALLHYLIRHVVSYGLYVFNTDFCRNTTVSLKSNYQIGVRRT